jgi:hypothetical protein
VRPRRLRQSETHPSGSHRGPLAPGERGSLSPASPLPPFRPSPYPPPPTPQVAPSRSPISPQAALSPPHPPPPHLNSSSGFPAPSCRLYFIATSGVCLFPQAPLVFPSKRLHSQNKTKTRVGDITVSVGYEYSEGGKCDGDVVVCERVPYRPSRSLMRTRTAPQSFHIHARRPLKRMTRAETERALLV